MRAHPVLSILALACVAGGFAAPQPAVSASAAWVVAPPPGSASTPVYLEVQNPTMYDVYVVSASSDAAAAVEFRDASGAGAREPTLVREFTVPAYGSVTLKPGGLHVVLKDLKKPLNAGDTVGVSLTTDGSVTVKVSAVVK